MSSIRTKHLTRLVVKFYLDFYIFHLCSAALNIAECVVILLFDYISCSFSEIGPVIGSTSLFLKMVAGPSLTYC